MRENWIEATLGEVCNINMGQSPPSSTYNTEKIGLPFFQGKAEFTTLHPVVIKWCSEPKKIANENDILLSVRAPVGTTNVANQKCAIGRGLAAISYSRNYKYILYYLKLIERKLDSQGTGTTFKAISGNILKSQTIPIPPLPEQRAIVAKTEQLFSELDNGVANLKAAKDKLEIFRQAVLKKAFEGELTKEWRKQQTNLPTTDELLEKISKKRKTWIEAEVAKGNTEAKRIGNKLKKLKTTAHISEKIPTGWCWASFLQSCHLVIDCHNKTAPYEDNGIHLVRTTNVRNGRLNLKEKIKYVSQETFEYWSRRCIPEPGDILFTREAPMGEAAIIPKDTQVCMGQRMMLLKVFSNCLNNKYLLYNILSATFQQRSIKNAIGTGVKHLRVGDVEQLVFPICSYEEQVQIVQEIETRLSVCDNAIANIEESLIKSEALRQSILKKAFEGKLLTNTELQACRQEPDWEPAAKLLERIKNNKQSTPRKKSTT